MSAPAPVLVVDDDEVVRASLRAFLEDEGFAVATAASGEEALERLAAGPARVVVVDIRLPGMNGNELIQRAHLRDAGLRFVVYTGSCEYSIPRPVADAGLAPEHVFHKPLFDMGLLARAVATLAAGRERVGPLGAVDRGGELP